MSSGYIIDEQAGGRLQYLPLFVLLLQFVFLLMWLRFILRFIRPPDPVQVPPNPSECTSAWHPPVLLVGGSILVSSHVHTTRLCVVLVLLLVMVLCGSDPS